MDQISRPPLLRRTGSDTTLLDYNTEAVPSPVDSEEHGASLSGGVRDAQLGPSTRWVNVISERLNKLSLDVSLLKIDVASLKQDVDHIKNSVVWTNILIHGDRLDGVDKELEGIKVKLEQLGLGNLKNAMDNMQILT